MSGVTTAAQETTPAATEASGKAEAEVKAPESTTPATTEAEAKPADKAPAEETKPPEQKPVVPEKYDIKLPDGSLLDPARVEKIAALAKERGLSNEDAQGLLNSEHEAIASFVSTQQKAMEERSQQWMTVVQNDNEMGGEAFKANVEHAKRAVERFGSPELKSALDNTGLGNHPELVRAFMRIGKAMAEDKFVHGGGATSAGESKANVLYGSKSSKK